MEGSYQPIFNNKGCSLYPRLEGDRSLDQTQGHDPKDKDSSW